MDYGRSGGGSIEGTRDGDAVGNVPGSIGGGGKAVDGVDVGPAGNGASGMVGIEGIPGRRGNGTVEVMGVVFGTGSFIVGVTGAPC